MPERDDAHDDTVARLRAALSSRAAAVEPAGVEPASLAQQAARARAGHRRRLALLSAAAAIVVAMAVAGAVALTDDGGEELSTGGPTTTSSSTTSTSTTTTSTSTTTSVPADDGVAGWPGYTSRVFTDPQSAAFNFVTDVLGFADPHQSFSEGNAETDASFTFSPRPTASIATVVTVHHTGAVRGWVVTGVTSDQGTIDSVSFEDGTVTLSGTATAFEATVHVAVLDQEGNVLAESFTMAGANGEQGPFETTIDVDPAAGTPFWVMIAESDASGEGTFVWAATASLAAA